METDDSKVFIVSWDFSVRADSQEAANAHIQALMGQFAEFMKWPKPTDLQKDARFVTRKVPRPGAQVQEIPSDEFTKAA
jgi:hypothetical protein